MNNVLDNILFIDIKSGSIGAFFYYKIALGEIFYVHFQIDFLFFFEG